ncbi:MAG: RNA-binding protein [Desulfobulbaceae bacterium]
MRIYISNLSYQVTAEDLRGAFVTFKNVASVFIVKDRATGKSKGFGYVDISPDSEAQAAIELLTGKLLQGRKMALKVALPPLEKREGSSPLTTPHDYNSREKRPRDRRDRVTGSKAQSGKGAQKTHSEKALKDASSKKRGPGSRPQGNRGGQGGGRRH